MPQILEQLNLEEMNLTTAISQRVGVIALQETNQSDANIFDQFANEFSANPDDVLAKGRDTLVTAIAKDPTKTRLLMDTYRNVTLKLDKQHYANFTPGEQYQGIPSYIPDGLVDGGRRTSFDLAKSKRELLVVDKAYILDRYRPVLDDVFTDDYSQDTPKQRDLLIVARLAKAVYETLNSKTALDAVSLHSGRVNLSGLNEGTCRHQALTLQVLAQYAGVTSRLIKCDVSVNGSSPEAHAANAVKIGDEWKMIDPSHPVISYQDGQKNWDLGMMDIDAPPQRGESRTYDGQRYFSDDHYEYSTYDTMNWFLKPEDI